MFILELKLLFIKEILFGTFTFVIILSVSLSSSVFFVSDSFTTLILIKLSCLIFPSKLLIFAFQTILIIVIHLRLRLLRSHSSFFMSFIYIESISRLFFIQDKSSHICVLSQKLINEI